MCGLGLVNAVLYMVGVPFETFACCKVALPV